MKKTKFEYAIEFTLPWEAGRNRDGTIREDGGYVIDTGGETKWGISKKANPTIDIKALTKTEAVVIYKTKYWDNYNLDKEEICTAIVMFDTGVNVGPGLARKWLKTIEATPSKVKNPAKALVGLREAHYFDLVTRDPATYKRYKQGWLNRTNDLKKYIDIVALETQVPLIPQMHKGQDV